ncbi:FecR domain-containing protein [Candidatus Pelagibacter sp.]|nr:FecR domain-containing protein [Candidatus Pelagibacter sp.]
MNISHKKITLNYRNFFFKIFFLYIFFTNIAFSEGTKIGSITEINGEVIAITEEGDERILDVYDEIYLKDEILIGESSSATIQFDDNTTIVMKELTSLNVSEFEKSGVKQKFQAKVGKGKIIIETGAIAKNANGEMLIDLSNMSLGIRGTRFNASIKPNGNSEVALAEDSFGSVGQIEISSEGQSTSLTSTDQVIEVTETREISQREQSDEEKQEFKSVNETLVKVSKIDENELTQQLEEKLAKGNLQDANNDGVVDASDVEAAKEIIKEEKKQKIDFIVENSNDENTTFLSDVIDQSDDQNIGETIEKIIETKDTLVEGVVGNLSDKDNEFITTSTSEGAGLIKEKIFETIVAKETDKSAEVLSKVMAKSDEATINSVINNITEKNTNEESKLSLKVMADFSEKSPEKLQTLSETNKDQIDKLAVSAVEKASTSNEDANLIAKVVSVASDELANKVVEEVSKNNTSEKQDLSAKVLKAIVETQPNKIEIINDEIKEVVIKQTVEAVKTQQETEINIAIEDDLTDAVAAIIVSTDNDTASKLIEEVSNVETETNLSLKVIAGISEKSAEKFTELAETNKEQVEKLTISAIQNAENTSEDSQRIANVVAIADDELANKVVEEVSKTAVEEKQSLSIKVLKAIVDTEPEKIEIINEEIKEELIEKAIEATKDQQEGNLIEEEDLTDAVTDIIVKTDTTTAAKMIEEINEIDTETNLSLEVISGISEKDSEKLNELSDNNKEQMDELTIDAVQKAENTSEDSELIANVVAVVNNDLVNVMIEEVSKVSIEEKQTLSAKVLQKIVETEPDKMEIIDDEVKDVMIKQTVESAKNQKEGTGIQEEENFTDIVSEIIVNTNTDTASKVIEEINEIDTETNLSLEVISGISEKDSGKLNELSDNNKEQMDELTTDAVQKAENTSEDSQLIANVVAVVNDDLVNKVVEEVSKSSTDEKQTLSAKVLKAIVDTEPSKIENINEETKTTIIKQTLEAAKNQEEGQILEEENLSDVVADIVVKTDVATASKIIEEVNNTETETSLSLKVMSGISEKDAGKINELAENNKENIDKLTEKAIQSAKSTKEDSELIAKVVSVASDEIANKVVEEVSKTSTEDKQDLSAKVLKAIVDTEPSKIETLDTEIKDKVIEQAIDAAKNQQENLTEGQTLSIEDDLTDVVADIVTKADNDTAAKVLETLNEASEETDSKLSLSVVENLTKKDNYEEKIEILSVTSSVVDESINKIMENAVEEASDEGDIDKVKNIVKNSKGTLSNKLIDSANKNEESKKKITEVIVDIVQENPEKAVEILEKNKNTNTVTETIKTKIENEEAVTSEDFEDVFETNVSPN